MVIFANSFLSTEGGWVDTCAGGRIKKWGGGIQLQRLLYNKQRCDGSDGKAEDSGLKGPELSPRLRPEKVKIFS